MVVALSYSEQEFTQDLRNTFIASVAVAADVQHFRVKINSVEETQAHSFVIVKVDFSVKVPTDEPAKVCPVFYVCVMFDIRLWVCLLLCFIEPCCHMACCSVM